MTSDEFIAWAMEQPETRHYELFDGEVLAMAPERSVHALTKFHIARRLAGLIEAASLARDVGAKLEGYFRLPSLRHYLIVRTENRTVVHHARGEDGIILTRIIHETPINLDPPGITLTEYFPPGVA